MKRDEILILSGLVGILAIMMFFTSNTYSANYITQQIANEIQNETEKQTKILTILLDRQYNISQTNIVEFDQIFKILANESKENLIMFDAQNIVVDNIANNITDINKKLEVLISK